MSASFATWCTALFYFDISHGRATLWLQPLRSPPRQHRTSAPGTRIVHGNGCRIPSRRKTGQPMRWSWNQACLCPTQEFQRLLVYPELAAVFSYDYYIRNTAYQQKKQNTPCLFVWDYCCLLALFITLSAHVKTRFAKLIAKSTSSSVISSQSAG